METIFVVLIVWLIFRRIRRRRSRNASVQEFSSGNGQRTGSAGNLIGSGGWYTDPTSRYALRYWDGASWTENVTRGDGSTCIDPIVT